MNEASWDWVVVGRSIAARWKAADGEKKKCVNGLEAVANAVAMCQSAAFRIGQKSPADSPPTLFISRR